MGNLFAEWLAEIASGRLIPIMLVVFVVAVVAKAVVYFVARKSMYFADAIDMRVTRHMDGWYEDTRGSDDFRALSAHILDRSFNEVYLMRHRKANRRKEDPIVHLINRMFLIEDGAKKLVETLKTRLKLMDAYADVPDFRRTVAYSLSTNQYLEKAWGFIPVSGSGRVFQALPGLFIISGILGTFLGITLGLPELRTIDASNLAETKETLSRFLETMTFAMTSSVVGIVLSIVFTVLNSVLHLDSTRRRTLDRISGALDLLWHDAVEANRRAAVAPPESRRVRSEGEEEKYAGKRVPRVGESQPSV